MTTAGFGLSSPKEEEGRRSYDEFTSLLSRYLILSISLAPSVSRSLFVPLSLSLSRPEALVARAAAGELAENAGRKMTEALLIVLFFLTFHVLCEHTVTLVWWLSTMDANELSLD